MVRSMKSFATLFFRGRKILCNDLFLGANYFCYRLKILNLRITFRVIDCGDADHEHCLLISMR
jgi:hypothetical protein